MDLQEILSQVITSTNEIFEAEAGSVALLEPSGQEITIRAAVGAGADAVRGLTMPVSKGVIGWVVTHEEPALIPDVTVDSRFYGEVDKESGFLTKSILCVPMQVDRHTIGVIELMNMRPDYLSPNGLKILRVIADHAALAIENAQLLAETRRRAEEQVMLFEAMTIVTSDLALETVLDAVSRQVAEALNADLCIISDWQQPQDQLCTMQCYVGPGAIRPEEEIRSLATLPLFRSVLVSQNPRLIEADMPDLSPDALSWLKSLNVRDLLAIPLIYRRRTIGLVEIGRMETTDPLSHNELRLAQTMTAQAAVVIEHARLYDEAVHRLAEAKVLQEVMVAAASSLDFNQVLSGTIKALHRTLGIERLGFFLPLKDRNTIAPHPATIGFSLDREVQIPVDGSAAGWVIRNSKPLLLPDVRKSAHYYELAADTCSELCVPVILKGQVAAVLNAESSRLNAFDSDDLRFFMAIAAELAVALENADLFEEIRTAEANYRDLFDNANDFILTLDDNFKISSANKMALKSTGYQLDEVIGIHVTNFVKPSHYPVLYQLLKLRLASSASTSTFELPIIAKNGDEILLELTFRVRRDERRLASIHCIGRDITHRRQLEQQLQQTEKLSAIGKLVAGVAHELNNPLTSIIGYANMLQRGNIPTAYRDDLDVIARQAQRARVIVRDLLTFARKFDLETEPVDLNDIIHSSLLASKPELQAQGIQVIADLDFSLPQTMADPHQLEQVFINLISNAIQALKGINGARRLTIESRQVGSQLHLTFSDNGPGILPEIIHRIFDPFFSTKDVGEGTGLGLSICFGIISEHKGRIRAENLASGGASFYIELPIHEPIRPVAGPAESFTQEPKAAKPLRILAIDDEPPLLTLLQRILTQLGHTVDIVPAGKSALEKLAANRYDLVLCDVLMPDILGPQIYESAAQKNPTLRDRFVFITGNVVDKDTRLFLEKSGLPWLSKPFLPTDIEKLVNTIGRNPISG
jgi:two-component system NtrC family sensor kinase